jgi:hypothetical protein
MLQPVASLDRPSTSAIWLLWLAAGLLVMSIVSLAGTWLDDRTVSNQALLANVWAKPLKFQLSMAIQLITVWLALRYLAQTSSAMIGQKILIAALVVTVVFEAIYITVQGARGVPSHFNRATLWESWGASTMAVGAYVLVGTSAWIGIVAGWRWLNQANGGRDAMLFAIALGFVLMFVLAGWTGSALGQYRGPFTQPVSSIGVVVPITLWRLDVGDLRISHFMGNHVMQAVPVFAFFVQRKKSKIKHLLIAAFALAWMLATLYLLQRALANLGFI